MHSSYVRRSRKRAVFGEEKGVSAIQVHAVSVEEHLVKLVIQSLFALRRSPLLLIVCLPLASNIHILYRIELYSDV